MKVTLNNKFYRKEAIEEAIESFREFCSCRVTDDNFTVEIGSGENDPSIAGEFCNFALGFTKDRMLF